MTGIEPATSGVTVRRSNQLSYIRRHFTRHGFGKRRSPTVETGAIQGPKPSASRFAPQAGLEPATPDLEGRCSIQLSYWSWPVLTAETSRHFKSGREDLNLRPPAPKAGALPGCATPREVSPPSPNADRRASLLFLTPVRPVRAPTDGAASAGRPGPGATPAPSPRAPAPPSSARPPPPPGTPDRTRSRSSPSARGG